MQMCQVEHDTNKYLNECHAEQVAQQWYEQNAEDQVNDPKSNYYWATWDNLMEALGEEKESGKLELLLISNKPEFVLQIEKISKAYWVEYILALKVES